MSLFGRLLPSCDELVVFVDCLTLFSKSLN